MQYKNIWQYHTDIIQYIVYRLPQNPTWYMQYKLLSADI